MPPRQRPHDSGKRLIVFTRYPQPGKTKTRLIPALGPQAAADLHARMTEHTLEQVRNLPDADGVSVEVHFDGGDEASMRQRFGGDLSYRPQGGGDLGARMKRAFADAFQSGAARTVIVGTDCPGITADRLRAAFARLGRGDLVLGPASDGGYYLVGLRRRAPRLFDEITWGSDRVLQETLRAARQLGITVEMLEPLDDVDRPEDLEAWNRVAQNGRASSSQPRISIIIPTLNETGGLEDVLGCALDGDNVETLVVDAGSRDATPRIAAAHGVRVLCACKGRACQMNAGAAAAGGPILLFLHADTRLPVGFDRHVRETLARPGVAAGAFRLRIGASGRSLRFIQRVANWRARWLQMPYGDQALFLPAETFHRLGGFRDLPIMEDFDLVRRLRPVGRVSIAPAEVVTSARRWHDLGPWRTTWINQTVILGYYLGIPPGRLAAWYHRRRRPAPHRHAAALGSAEK